MIYEQQIELTRLSDGESGQSSFIHIKYSNDKKTFTNNSGEDIGIYLGIYTDNIEEDSMDFNKYKWSKIVGADGQKGSDGVSISSVDEHYAVSTSNSTIPTTWQDTVPTMTVTNKYLWNYETIHYSNNTSTDTSKRVIGVYGDTGLKGDKGTDGSNGKSIGSVTNYYLATSLLTGVDTKTSGWTTTIQTVTSEKKYLWNYEVVKYTDGNVVSTTTPCIIGVYGDRGEQGLQGIQGEKGEQGIAGEDGTDGKTTYFHIKYSSVAKPTSASQMSETPNIYIGTYVDYTEVDSTDPNKYTWSQFKGSKGDQGIPGTNGEDGKTSYLHLAYANSADGKTGFDVSNSSGKLYIGQYTDFNSADSIDPTKYSWTKIKGETGATGTGIDSVTKEFYLSTSKTTQQGGSWATTMPTWENGKYIWTREKIVYKNPASTVYTTPSCDTGWEAANEVDKKVTTLQTDFKVEQGKITSLIKETETIKGDVTTLSDKYNETVKTVEGNTTTIANIKTSVDTNTKNISSMDSRITEIKQTADGVSTTVTNNKSKWDKASTDASSALTKATQNADKFSWLVKSGTSSTDFTLTDRTAELVAENINLNGRVTFKGLSSDAQTKISNAESNASTALSTAKTANSTASTASTNASSALEKANSASSNASSALTKASNAETNASNALSKANSATTTANTANSTANTAKTTADSAVNLVRSTVTSLANGKLLYKDVKFDQGVNKINLYNNSSNGNVTITRQAKSSDNPCGNYELLIKNVGTSNPGCGGFAWSNKSRANAVFVYRIIAKIPTGRNIIWAANAFGSGANAQWLTSQNGTGKFTEYVLKATCGATGSFSSIGYFYIDGSVGTTDNPVTWNVAYAGCWDMTDYEDKANQSIIDNWAKDSIVNGETVINGGYIKTNTIETDQLAVDSIFATGSTVMNIINAQEIDATRITTGQLDANRLNVYGLTVINKTSNQQTFNVSPNGEVTMRGSVSSYDYHNGKTGWTINSDGSAEFNNVDVRGSVITNDGGIASSGGSGENLLLNSSLESNLDGWVNNSGYATTTLDGYNCTKVSGSLTTTKLLQQSITLKIKKDTTSIYTISGWVKLVNYKAGSTNPFCSLYFQGAYNNNGTSTWLGSTGISGNGSIIPQNNKGWQYITYTFRFAQIPTYMNFCVYARDFTGDLYVRDLKLEEGDIATPWSAAKDDKIKQVRFWAGATYEERENAPFVVYNDGWVKATQGEFSGIWTGDIKIGNISIVDPSASSGNDALLTIQNGDSGVKSIQLTDGNSSTFAQDLIISTNTSAYTPMITLKTDGTAVFNRGINIANSVTLNGSSLLMNNKELTTTSTGFLINGSLDVGSTSQTSNLVVHGSTTSDDIVVNNELRFGSVIKFTKMSNGINIDFIE